MVGKKSFLPTIRPGRRSKRTNLPGFSENPTESCEKKHRKIPPRKRSQTFLFGFAIVIIVLHFIIESFGKTSVPSDGNALVERSIINNEDKTSSTFVSVVILTYKNPELLSNLLSSVISQKPDKFEVIIVDAGCLDETQDVIIKHFPQNSETEKRLKYLPQCHNPGYAISNNEAVKMAARSSKWILLLNDDLELQGNLFIDEMLKLGNSKPNLSIVGCKMLNGSGDEIDEAGSIVWKDATAAGFGRGRKDINASEFMYPRPVDYVSGACIMVKKRIFDDYGGFDSEKFPNYYEDTDLQMHVQHELEKEVWLQPRAIALHNAHASFGSEAGTKLMTEHSKIFKKKWDFYLRDKHLAAPFHLSQQQQEVTFLKANDLRARDHSKANILYIDLDIPKNIKSQQINRSYQNLSLLSRLGHRITVVSYHETTDEKCDLQCRDDIQKYGIEVAMGSWYELAEKRAGFYDIVVISQPSTFLLTYKELATLYQKAPFVLIYDFDTFQYLAYESIIKLQKNGYTLPSISYESVHQPEHEIMLTKQSEIEHKLIATADFVVTSSPKDIEKVSTVYPNTLIHSISHVQSKKQQKFPSFDDRSGILFLLSFGVNTDYNFDAIFFFLENIYMNVLKEAHSSIPLTIAGKFIPENLRVLVEKTTEFNDTVTFIQTSEEYYTTLYDTARIVILPHPYGNRLDYQLVNAFSHGVPTVMSRVGAESVGISIDSEIGCIGLDIDSFKTCIVKLYNDEIKWKALQSNAWELLERNQSIIESKWSDIIEVAKDTYKRWYNEFHSCKINKKKRERKGLSWGWKNPAVKIELGIGNPIEQNDDECKFHVHKLDRIELAVTIPKEQCSKWWKKYNSRSPTDMTFVGDNAYMLLCSS